MLFAPPVLRPLLLAASPCFEGARAINRDASFTEHRAPRLPAPCLSSGTVRNLSAWGRSTGAQSVHGATKGIPRSRVSARPGIPGLQPAAEGHGKAARTQISAHHPGRSVQSRATSVASKNQGLVEPLPQPTTHLGEMKHKRQIMSKGSQAVTMSGGRPAWRASLRWAATVAQATPRASQHRDGAWHAQVANVCCFARRLARFSCLSSCRRARVWLRVEAHVTSELIPGGLIPCQHAARVGRGVLCRVP